MPQWAIVAIAILAVLVVAEAIWIVLRRHRTDHLRERFGPEYDRAAESDLVKREKRVEKFHIRPLSPQDRERFAETWHADQSRFVDDPEAAVTEADRLVVEVMEARGYPVTDFEQRVADVSVDHAHVIGNYQTAADIARRQKRGTATTEDLRRAMVYYRELFEDLLEIREVRHERRIG